LVYKQTKIQNLNFFDTDDMTWNWRKTVSRYCSFKDPTGSGLVLWVAQKAETLPPALEILKGLLHTW
jgi:hypothetical protein